MLIHILRHGVAEVASAGMKDADRALTAEGIKKLRAILRAARAAEVSPKIILTSPYRRAVQTADLAAEILGNEGDVRKTDALSPASHPEEVWQEIRRHRQEEQLLLAGHEPLLGLVIGYLLGAPDLQVDFKKGAIACIYMDAFGPRPRGVLKWLVTPKLIGTKP
jgi:phosphohistidine phosphatase